MEAKMANLSNTQLMMLSKASQREDRAVECSSNLKRGAVKAVVTKLLDRELVNEVAAKRGMPVWRQDDDGGSVALVITRAGLKAIGADAGEADADEPRLKDDETEAPRARPKGRGTRESGRDAPSAPPATGTKPEFRAGSKQALILSMLQRKTGANLADLVSATGWLPHTTRAALTGLRKRGYVLERSRAEGKPSIYRVAQGPAQSTAA
jgi:DNA-binding MarR family transcriptional regulator